ncbi:hypothetical protein Dimus_030474, partial [Dionaea muscipula]
RPREVESDARSPDWRPVIFRGSPSPRPPRGRRGPPSPGARPRRQRSPSPLISPSTDLDEVSSSDEEDASEAAVTASEVEDLSDLEAAGMILSQAPDLSLILEDEGKFGALGSTISGSPLLSLSAVVLACQKATVAVVKNLVSSLSSDKVSHSLALSSMEGGDLAAAIGATDAFTVGDGVVSGVPLLGGGEVDPGCAAIGGLVFSMGAGSGSRLIRVADSGDLLEADSRSSQIPIAGVRV